MVADEKWGDWRPHLAIILSNIGHRPDLDMKSIVTLGDTLGKKLLSSIESFMYKVDF